MSDWVILGCGYVGTRLARALLAEGHRVRACSRHVDKLADLQALGAQLHALDASRARAFGPALYGLSSPTVLYSIPPVVGMPPGEALRRASEVAMTSGAPRFIYLSSTAVYGETPDGEIVDESTSLAIGDAEAGPRIAEESAVETARNAGLSTVILRLSAIYGPGRGVRERLKAGTYKLIDDGIHYYSRVYVDDVVALIRTAADRAPHGAIYCVADDRPTTQREYTEWLARRLGVPLPPSVASLAPGAPRRAVRNRRVANARLKQELDFTFRFPSYLEGEAALERESGIVPAEPAKISSPPPAPAVATPVASPAVTQALDDPTERTVRRMRADETARTPASDGDRLQQVALEVEELWSAELVRQLDDAAVHLDADRPDEARRVLARSAAIAVLLDRQAALRLPWSRAPLAADRAATVWAAFDRALIRRGAALKNLFAHPSPEPALLAVADQLLALDGAVAARDHRSWFPQLAAYADAR